MVACAPQQNNAAREPDEPDEPDAAPVATTPPVGQPEAGPPILGGGIPGEALATGKLDVLLVVDNSISMADKQEIFRDAIPDLLRRLTNPVCRDDAGTSHQPLTAEEACPAGLERQFAAVRDLHIGVVTSSLGTAPATTCDSAVAEKDDRGHLVGTLPRALSVPTYDNSGFLAWDPDAAQVPPGETDLTRLVTSFQGQVDLIGELGCGYESTLEAWYRFLVDPEPPASFVEEPCAAGSTAMCARADGIDQELLGQRARFLRSDSAVIVMILTDEDDCSGTRVGQGFYPFLQNARLPRASSMCSTAPNDPCCYPCIAPPATCPVDPTCAEPSLAPEEDDVNLRCFHQKQRFGIDWLEPPSRYVAALTQPQIQRRDGTMVPNPLFVDVPTDGAFVRRPEHVFVVGIAGIPWQDLATTETLGAPGQLKLLSAEELETSGRWGVLLGDVAANIAPTDPLLIGSVDPRSGTNPVTGGALASPFDGYLANPINGHERQIPNRDDLQYSCIFPLRETRDCATATGGCDCNDVDDYDTNPLCQDPATGAYGTLQRHAKAYPPPRILEVLRGVGPSAVVASICPKNVDDTNAEDFGYRPVFGTLLEDVAPVLR